MGATTANNGDFIGQVLQEIKTEIDKHKSSESMESVFFSVMEKLVQQNRSYYSFIKYLNIFNSVGADNVGNIEFYAEFIHSEQENVDAGKSGITSDRGKINTKSELFNKETYTIAKLFRETRKFGESFEYSIDGPLVLDNNYHVTCAGKSFTYSKDLDGLFDEVIANADNEEESEKKKKEFEHWLGILQNCYGDKDDVTHFFLVNGPIYFGTDEKLEQELSKYVVNANIGVRMDENSQKDTIFGFIRQFKKLIEQISFNLIIDIKDYQMRQEAVRAAIAQVMARNMSHNFGSHVLSNLVGDGVYEKLDDEAVKKLKYFNPEEKDEVYKDLYKALEEPEKPGEYNKSKNHQLQYFFQYLKTRMDYLSEVTFGVPNLLTAKMMYGEVMKELDQVRILLNYISGVSNFKYCFTLLFDKKKIPTETDDIGVAFPSDVLGCHAFYNIIENIIRNTAKHAKNDGRTVTFTITFKDVDDEGCEDIEEAAELYCVEIVNGVFEDGIDELVNKQNDRLNQSVLENNHLRSSSLGLLEMEASAAFLRQIDLPEIESDDYLIDHNDDLFHERNGIKRLNILKAFAKKDKQSDKRGRLGYRFFVQKPKEFLFVGKWDVDKAKKRELLNLGIQFVSADQFMKDLKSEKAFAHQFLVYDSTQCQAVRKMLEKARDISIEELDKVKEQLRSYRTLLPLRKLKISEDEKKKISSYWGGNNDKAILQKLKEWTYQNELLKEEMVPSSDIFIRTSIDTDCSNQVVFLDHANETGHLKECDGIPYGKDAWIENLTSQTRVKLPVFTELSKGCKEKLINNYVNNIRAANNDDYDLSGKKRMIREEIFEAYHNKVIILDERVQKFAEKNSEGEEPKIPCWSLFRSTNVFIPFPSERPIKYKDEEQKERYSIANWIDKVYFSLDPNDFGEIKEKIKTFVDYYSKEYNPKSKPFILVHYGILERMYGGDVEGINKLLEQWVEMSKRVVVTSGRGAHSLDLPKSVCFVNLSSVLYVCNENRNKYLINYLLNQSRRKRNE